MSRVLSDEWDLGIREERCGALNSKRGHGNSLPAVMSGLSPEGGTGAIQVTEAGVWREVF